MLLNWSQRSRNCFSEWLVGSLRLSSKSYLIELFYWQKISILCVSKCQFFFPIPFPFNSCVLVIILKGLLTPYLLLAEHYTPIVISELKSTLATNNPTVLNFGAAVTKLLHAEVAGSVILFVMPNAIAKHVVDVQALLSKFKDQTSVPICTLIDVFGDYLVDEFSLRF